MFLSFSQTTRIDYRNWNNVELQQLRPPPRGYANRLNEFIVYRLRDSCARLRLSRKLERGNNKRSRRNYAHYSADVRPRLFLITLPEYFNNIVSTKPRRKKPWGWDTRVVASTCSVSLKGARWNVHTLALCRLLAVFYSRLHSFDDRGIA